MLIMFQTQMESVGLHQINWQGSSQSALMMHVYLFSQTCVETDRPGYRHNSRREQRPRKVHSHKQWDPGSCGDSDRHCGIIHFHPPEAEAGQQSACFWCFWWLKLSAYNNWTFPPPIWTNKPRSLSDLIRVMLGWSKLRLPIHNNR